LAVAVLTAGLGSVLTAPAQAAGSTGSSARPLVMLLDNHIARSRPSVRARKLESVPARRPLTRVRTVLPVLGHATSRDGRAWLRVRLPGRPNGHKGWITRSETRRISTQWSLAVKLSTRQVTVYRGSWVAKRFRAVVGTASTPTPRGRFFIEEALSLSPSAAGGPFALATSARSQVLQQFAGGPGQIALHGTNNLFDPLGSAASHGCIRLSTDAITWLARRIGAGVPLTISR
jgi:lipoprotein-anchoring transpeptidase ErfK/SrfK